ncbi:hypothetical protein AURDEDRAFT_166507 [Auricularia subglabra TFB-10046 SS5]|nr:hypothetical protein AURDEDRAFT_166507 [Auricularia subglabra TFB-10046 SS5]
MPLNQLEKMQMSKLRDWKFASYVLNHETKTPQLLDTIRKREFRVLCTSPEMLDLLLGDFMSNPDWAKDLMLVIDEAHCIPRWKDSFRKCYGRIGVFRAHLPHKIPVVACTATATLEDENIIRNTLHFGADAEIVNLGNHRHLRRR